MTFAALVNQLVSFISTWVISLLFAFAFISFLYGVFKFFFTGGEENRTKGKQFVFWGIIGFVVLFSLWGIVNFFLSVVKG
jgi:hypothetical protein